MLFPYEYLFIWTRRNFGNVRFLAPDVISIPASVQKSQECTKRVQGKDGERERGGGEAKATERTCIILSRDLEY